MSFFTADLCDNYCEQLEVLGPDFKSYGGTSKFSGEVVTIKLDKNNKQLASYLKETDGTGKVVVVDVNMRYFAVVGDNLMRFATESKFEGIIVNGYVRDTLLTKEFETGLVAKGTCPRKYSPEQAGEVGVAVNIDGVDIESGYYIYADSDGIVVAKEKIV